MKIPMIFRKAMSFMRLEDAVLFAKSAKDGDVEEDIKEKMILRLKEIGFDGKNPITSFSSREQKEILRYLPHVTTYLLELLEKRPKN